MIDRHNYEEFFLLYVDNELTVEQKKLVELFIKDNADLEEELVMLQQSKLLPDDGLVFHGKEKLMKEENGSLINMNNYEEYLVLYVDDELNGKERSAVEEFAAKHTHIKEELVLFQQTKLQPEEIIFADKQSLYRREEKVRVINMSWWRVAVAAVLIIAALVTGYTILNNKNNKGAVKEETTIIEQQNTHTNDVNETVKKDQKQDQDNSISNNTSQPQVAIAGHVINKGSQALRKREQRKNNLPVVEKEQIAHVKIPVKPMISNVIVPLNANQPAIKSDVAIGEKQSKLFIKKDDVTSPIPPSYNPTDNKAEDGLAANESSNKRLRGFFRKATRFIERTTNVNPANDDDKVLIGGMAINLK